MNAKIGSIRLIKNSRGLYWLITLIDDNGNIIGTFGDENHCSDIDFRNQTFGIMKILNNWSLLKLDGINKSFPVLVDKEIGRINYIANSSGDYLKIDYITGEVLTGTGCDISHFHQEYISDIISKSGVLFGIVRSNPPGSVSSERGVSADMAYLGFKPVYDRYESEEREKEGALSFRIFVCGMLYLCNVNELIQSNNYPEVSIKFDSDNNIVALGAPDGQEYLCISDNGYEFSSGNKRK